MRFGSSVGVGISALLLGSLAVSGCDMIETQQLKSEAMDAVRERFSPGADLEFNGVHAVSSTPGVPPSTVCGTVTAPMTISGNEPIPFSYVSRGQALLATDHDGLHAGTIEYLCTGQTSDEETRRTVEATEALIEGATSDAQ